MSPPGTPSPTSPAASAPAPSAGGPSSLGDMAAVILAAGQGTRMKSQTPKVLHPVAGRPLLHYPVRAALEAGCREVVVVVGHGRGPVEAYLAKAFGGAVKTALQAEQRGTGDAARAGVAALGATTSSVLVFYGDVPLLMASDIEAVGKGLASMGGGALALATCRVADPFGYGRILRNGAGQVVGIREQKDLREGEGAIDEINPGIYAAPRPLLVQLLDALRPDNAQKELYLTDVVAHSVAAGKAVVGVPSRAEVLLGVNDRAQLAEADQAMRARIVRAHRVAGVTVHDGARIDDGVELGPDVVVEAGAVLRGKTRVGSGTLVDVGCVLTDAQVGDAVNLKPYSVVTESRVGARAQVGPFAHLRPESDLGEDVHVGNFVETKKTRLDKGAKANHLAYLGDGFVGEGANIGAGTIFCNYDGYQKHVTTIGKGAFIGSDSQLVAPVTVGDGAYVGTGTTVTRDVPPDALAIGRAKQENKEGYAARLRARFKAAKEAAKAGVKPKTPGDGAGGT